MASDRNEVQNRISSLKNVASFWTLHIRSMTSKSIWIRLHAVALISLFSILLFSIDHLLPRLLFSVKLYQFRFDVDEPIVMLVDMRLLHLIKVHSSDIVAAQLFILTVVNIWQNCGPHVWSRYVCVFHEAVVPADTPTWWWRRGMMLAVMNQCYWFVPVWPSCYLLATNVQVVRKSFDLDESCEFTWLNTIALFVQLMTIESSIVCLPLRLFISYVQLLTVGDQRTMAIWRHSSYWSSTIKRFIRQLCTLVQSAVKRHFACPGTWDITGRIAYRLRTRIAAKRVSAMKDMQLMVTALIVVVA